MAFGTCFTNYFLFGIICMKSYPEVRFGKRRSEKMRTSFVIVLVLCVLGLMTLNAQPQQPQLVASASPTPSASLAPNTPSTSPVTVLEPERSGVPYLLKEIGLGTLERQGYVERSGFREVSAFVFDGKTSPVQVPAAAVFVVKLDGGDPSELIGIHRLASERKTRAQVRAKLTALGSTTVKTTVDVEFEKYGSASVKVVPTSPLAKGEYALWSVRGDIVWLFGVD